LSVKNDAEVAANSWIDIQLRWWWWYPLPTPFKAIIHRYTPCSKVWIKCQR